MPNDELSDRLKKRIAAKASSFDPMRLVELLASYGVERSQIVFESNPERASASVVESVSFTDDGGVVIRTNLGLLGDRGTLPTYFQLVVERGGANEAFHEFVRFFDNRLIENLLRSTYPERDETLFENWPRTVEAFRRMAAVASEGLLQSLLAKVFPELRVHVRRASIERSTPTPSFVMGLGDLDGGALLGEGVVMEPKGFAVDLVAHDAVAGGGRRWPDVVAERFRSTVEPALKGQQIALEIDLTVVDHEERAGLVDTGFLGYQRVGGDSSTVHRIRLFRGVVGEAPISNA